MRIYFLSILLMFSAAVTAQSLFVSRDVQRAYQKQTRTREGKPGKNYWQNRGEYTIRLSAMLPGRIVKGEETITYFNNSPDTLRSLVVKLFLNVHKPQAPREFPVGRDFLTEGMQVEKVSVNGSTVQWDSKALFTSEGLRLPQPLAPHSKVELGFSWQFEISTSPSREGMIDSTSCFLAYFYPRVAVYDDYNGWDNMEFTNSREFYNDFNDYDVTITVPANYVVWGTGSLQQPEKLLQPDVLQRYRTSLQSDKVIQIATAEDIAGKKVTANAVNEWRFTSKNICDVAFGISDHYIWDGCSVIVDDATGRRASAQAAYTKEAKDFEYVARFAQHSLGWFSHQWPGIAYPYEKSTVFQGFADMEYPMMANNSSFPDTTFSKFVAEHEIAHTYFPFYMGINETKYGFMDEGITTLFEYLIGIEDLGLQQADSFFKRFRVSKWINNTASTLDVPVIVPSDGLLVKSFGNNIYGKPALAYIALKDYLGNALFKKCLHEYMSRWNGKHPVPWDFFYTFNNVSGKNLDWFWKTWFMDISYIDIAIKNVQQKGNQYRVALHNKGGMTIPVDVKLVYADGTTESKHYSAALWEKNQSVATVNISAKKAVKTITVDGGIFMDAAAADNVWENK